MFYRGALVGLVLVLIGFYAVSIYAPGARVGQVLADLPCGQVGNPCQIEGRTYHLAAPKGTGPFPIVLAFHGSGGSGANFVGTTWFVNKVLGRGYVLIAPDALDIDYSGGRRSPGWIFQGQRGDRDDHRFVSAVLDDVRDRFGLGSRRILLAGFSNGATFAWYLACSRNDRRFRAVAPAAGALVRRRPLGCAGAGHRFHLLQTHGRADETYPLAGSLREGGWPGWQAPEDSVALMAEKADCRGRTDSETGPFQRTTWTGCASRVSIGIALHDGGHSVPTAWADMVLDWFEALPASVR